jgi:hypothetical protein
VHAQFQRLIQEPQSLPPAQYRFSFDAPARSQFTKAEKATHRALGKVVSSLVGVYIEKW